MAEIKVYLPIQLNEKLVTLGERVNRSKKDIVKQALQLYEYLVTRSADGAILTIVEHDGNTSHLELLGDLRIGTINCP